jgi:outer membrane protein insertion porin family/translocation and assembly module TamA
MQVDSSTHIRCRTSAPQWAAASTIARCGFVIAGARAALSVVRFSFALAAALSLAACASIPRGRAAIDSVEIVGARAVDPGAILDKLATASSPRLFGLFPGLGGDYSIYDASILQRDLARVERFYRGRGFFEAHARVGRLEHNGESHVRVQIVVDEGPPVNNGAVRIDGLDGIPPAVADAVRAAARAALPEGTRFDEEAYKGATSEVAEALKDRAYAYATVQSSAQIDLASHTIAYALAVTPGITAVYGPVSFVGLDPDGAGPAPQEISDTILRRVMHLREGRPYSAAEVRAAEQSLLDLEVFSSAHVDPRLADPPAPVIPLVVELEPTKLRSLRLGGGAEFDAIKTDLHVLAGWEDHNLLGGLRDFSVDFSPGVILYPLTTFNLQLPNKPFFEEKLRLQLRQPGFLESRTTAFVRPELNVYPLLLNSRPQPTDRVIGYIEPKGAIGAERRFGKHVFATFVYNVQSELPFEDLHQGCDSAGGPCVPPPVFLTIPQITLQFDFKDDSVHPHAGVGASIDVQFATPPGTASDFRLEPEVEAYVPIARNVTFALDGALGVLIPLSTSGYQGYVERLGREPPGSTRNDELDIETMYFRGFFGGGPSDNRGYPLRGVAPHGWVPFLNPSTAASDLQNHPACLTQITMQTPGTTPPANDPRTNPSCLSPIGGFSMWRASAEMRISVSGPFGVGIFCDVGDASQSPITSDPANAFRFRYLHMSCGAGLRYDTPVGPFRLDVAYRLPYLQLLGCATQNEQVDPNAKCHGDPTFGVQPEFLGVVPMAFAFGIGEAF